MMRSCVVTVTVMVMMMMMVRESDAFQPRRIQFARCSYDQKIPRAVFMTCANQRGVCEVRLGQSHNLRAVFIPDINATDIDSYVRWNSYFEIPLPGQNRDACEVAINCPVKANYVTRFTYSLAIQDFWPRDEYPVKWSLTDRATDTVLVCFKFKINIV